VTTDRMTTRDNVSELAFLHEIAQLATQARDWDELMRWASKSARSI
jgi:DnaJ-domain-containing protein 1